MDTGLAPGFARWTYTGATGAHHGLLPVNLVDGWVSGTEPMLTNKGGTDITAIAAVTEYIDNWKALVGNDQNIGLCEIYSVDPDTGEGTFVFGFDLATTGSSGGTSAAKRGMQITFKLTNGRVFRAAFMETGIAADVDQRPPFTALSGQAVFSDYVVSDDSIVYGRGNAYPFAPIRLLSKEYDVLRKRTGL